MDIADVADPARYGRTGPPYELFEALRRTAPVRWCAIDGFPPFWAVTRHETIRLVSLAPERFSSIGWINLPHRRRPTSPEFPKGNNVWRENTAPRTLLSTDPPFHRDLRRVTLPHLTPRALHGLEETIREITRTLLATVSGERDLDFVTAYASWHPLRVLCLLLGLRAEGDEEMLLRLTHAFIGSADPEFAGSADPSELAGWLGPVIESRRSAGSREDLSGIIANAPFADEELLLYLMIIAVAGHDTTRSAMAGGMHALAAFPEQLELLRARPALCESAANEIVRWTSPVVHFLRTAVEDCELDGTTVAAGERLALFYPSANRDTDVFEAPEEFRVDRDPNPHLGWGVGEHYCLGANLARMEIRVFLEELLPRLESVRIAGDVEWLASNVVCGIKHLPLHWTVRPA